MQANASPEGRGLSAPLQASYYSVGLSNALRHDLNSWITRRLKAFLWNQWRLPRTKVKRLKELASTMTMPWPLAIRARVHGASVARPR
jgi:hypothetical protein